ncbi:MAG: riboflavin synthase [candidate division Zixibacteria bacterium]|nr:riboflavin synthase [candidate division Zixibacteria bacterium]
MFTGLVSEIGKVVLVSQMKEGKKLLVEARKAARELRKGDSVSVNGVCQTVTSRNGTKFTVLAMPETLKRTNFDRLKPGGRVNLELPLKLSGRLGGHFVTGHIDTQARLLEIEKRRGGVGWWMDLPKEFSSLVVEKGSVALEGVSLTVAGLKPGRFKVALIPHTLKTTTLGERNTGDFLNVEFDFLGKYIHQMVRARHPSTTLGINASPLRKNRGTNEI